MTSLFRNTILTLVVGGMPMAAMAHHLPEDGGAASTAHAAPAAAAPSMSHAAHGATSQAPGDATERALAQGRAEQLSVQGCWIRAMPAQLPSAGYFTVGNAGRVAAKLTGIVVPGYGMAMLHQTQKAGGMAKMVMADEIDVPAKGNLVFAPGGYHAMLEKPNDQAKVGALLPVVMQGAAGKRVRSRLKRLARLLCQSTSAQCRVDLAIRLVLIEGVDRPDGGRNPADQGDLENQADNAGQRSSNREENRKGQEQREQQAHESTLF